MTNAFGIKSAVLQVKEFFKINNVLLKQAWEDICF